MANVMVEERLKKTKGRKVEVGDLFVFGEDVLMVGYKELKYGQSPYKTDKFLWLYSLTSGVSEIGMVIPVDSFVSDVIMYLSDKFDHDNVRCIVGTDAIIRVEDKTDIKEADVQIKDKKPIKKRTYTREGIVKKFINNHGIGCAGGFNVSFSDDKQTDGAIICIFEGSRCVGTYSWSDEKGEWNRYE